MKVAVIAHSGKTLGGGLPELRRVLAAEGVDEPLWCEVPKSRKAPTQVRRALDEGAELVIAWGGDGMVQRCGRCARRIENEPGDHSGRYGGPVRRQSGATEGHRAGRRRKMRVPMTGSSSSV